MTVFGVFGDRAASPNYSSPSSAGMFVFRRRQPGPLQSAAADALRGGLPDPAILHPVGDGGPFGTAVAQPFQPLCLQLRRHKCHTHQIPGA